MKKNIFSFISNDKVTQINVVEFVPEGEKNGILQIAHGITEHLGRYENFVRYLTDKGFVVVVYDQIGHGKSVSKEKQPMYFGSENSWFYASEDFYTLYSLIKEKYQNIPYVALGFSLGSFIVRTFLIDHPEIKLNSAILMGTGQTSNLAISLGKLMANLEAKKVGEDFSTQKINELALENYNKNFKNVKTKCDWLCENEETLKEYLEDPLVGKTISCGLFRELLNGMKYTGNLSNIDKMQKDVPILLISGDDDSVGEFGKGVEKVKKNFKKSNIKKIDVKFLKGRHDILHEKNYLEVYEYIYNWIMKNI